MTKQFNGYFTDRNMDVLGLVSTTNPNTIKLLRDEEKETIEKGVTTFTADVSGHLKNTEGNTVPDLSMIKAGNYFLYEGTDGLAKMFTIIDVSKDAPDDVVNFYAEDGGLDTINEIVGDYEAKEAMVIAKYFELFLKNTGFKIGINELGTTYSRKLKWEGEATVTERLRSVAHQFEHAEINFSFEVKGMRVTQKYVNIYEKRGEQTGITLELNRHINRITSTETIANLATSLSPKGAIPEGKKEPISLKGHTYDDGRFFVENGFLRDRESNEIWSRFLSEGRGAEGGYINHPYSYDTTNVVTLRNSAITELKKVSQVAKNFEVDIAVLPDEVRVGDTINIVNQKGELYLEARVLQLTRSRVEDKAVAILGDYLIKDSGINEKLLEIAEMMNNLPKGDSSSLWIRYADDDKGNGFSASPANKKFVAMKTAINNPVPSEDPADYEGLWAKFMGPEGESIEGPPGKDGQPTYTWIRYADNVSGGGISAESAGKMYIGFAYNKDTATPSNTPADYAWSAMYDEAKMLELQEQINNIQIGGTNLIRDSAFDEGFKYYPTVLKGWAVDTTKKFMDQNTLKFQWETGVPTFSAVISDFMEVRESGLVGKEMILSVYVFIPESADLASMPYAEVAGYENLTQVTNTAFANSRIDIPIDTPKGIWTRFEKTFIVTDTTGNGKTNFAKVLLRHRVQGTPTVKDNFYYALPQLEFGNKLSDWNRNPADTPTTGDLSNAQTELQQQLGSIVVPVMQPNRPTPKENMVWWKTDVTGGVIGIEKYIGGKWEKQVIQQETLNIINLNAIKITGSEITGTEISGSTIISAFDEPIIVGTDIYKRGILKLDKGDLKNEFEIYNKNNPNVITARGTVRVSPDGIQTSMFDAQGKLTSASQYSDSGIAINIPSMPYGTVSLGYNDLINIPLKNMTPYFAKGWDAYSTEYYPQIYRAGKNIQIFGAMKPYQEVAGGAVWQTVMTLPPEYRPLGIVGTAQQGSLYNTFAFQILKNGEVQVSRHRNRGQDGVPFATTAWVNISFSYITA